MSATPSPATRPASDDVEKLPFPLQEGEQVLAICRRHWIYLWPYVCFKVAMAFLPVAILWWLFDRIDIMDGIVSQAFTVLAVLWIIYHLVGAALAWYHYRHDKWVVTNQRLIDTYRKHPFDLRISTADLINVQDMSIERSGILASTLDFGDVVCQTAATSAEFRITGIPNPRETQLLVDRERDRERNRLRGI
jgi:hypothetical protein